MQMSLCVLWGGGGALAGALGDADLHAPVCRCGRSCCRPPSRALRQNCPLPPSQVSNPSTLTVLCLGSRAPCWQGWAVCDGGISCAGKVLSLDSEVLQGLEQLLNQDCSGSDWIELAKRLGLCSLVETYKDTPSPSISLLRSYEVSAWLGCPCHPCLSCHQPYSVPCLCSWQGAAWGDCWRRWTPWGSATL